MIKVTINFGMEMPAWFDIIELGNFDVEKAINLKQCKENAVRINRVIKEEI